MIVPMFTVVMIMIVMIAVRTVMIVHMRCVIGLALLVLVKVRRINGVRTRVESQITWCFSARCR